jgi:hypothetical protein
MAKMATRDLVVGTSAGLYNEASVGKEEEKGKIDYFETHELRDMELVRKGIVNKKTHAFIADINGRFDVAMNYNEFIGVCATHGEIKKCIIAKT